jgi:hypothetical protein
MTAPLEQLAGYGAVGIMLVVALLALRALHMEHKADREAMLKAFAEERAKWATEREALRKELADESDARIQDSKDNTTLLMKVQQALYDAIGKLHDLAKAKGQ